MKLKSGQIFITTQRINEPHWTVYDSLQKNWIRIPEGSKIKFIQEVWLRPDIVRFKFELTDRLEIKVMFSSRIKDNCLKLDVLGTFKEFIKNYND